MVAQLLQPNGTLTTQKVETFSTLMAAGTAFPPSSAVPPASATANSVVLVDTYNSGNSTVALKASTQLITVDGTFSTPVHFTQIIEQNSLLGSQVVTVNPGTTTVTIDLTKGQSIKLMHDENVTITFSNIPSGASYMTPIMIRRYKANNTNAVTLSFSQTVIREGGLPSILSSSANAIDILVLYIDNNGKIYMRNVAQTFTAVSGSITVNPSGAYVSMKYNPPATQAITSNTLVSVTAGGQFISTDVAVDAADNSKFTSQVNSINNVFYLHYFPVVTSTTPVVTFDLSKYAFGYLLHNANVTSFSLTNVTLSAGSIFTLIRQQDNTTNAYTITWPANFLFDTPPSFTNTANAIDLLIFSTVNGTYFFVQCFQNFK
jgi:hypothetical protein